MNKDYRKQLRDLLTRPAWKRQLLEIVVNGLLLWQKAIDFWYYINFNFLFSRRSFITRTVQRAHYVGSHIAKPHRIASMLLVVVLFAGLVISPHTHAMLMWALGWGLVFSVIVIIKTLIKLSQRIFPTRLQGR